MISIIIYVPSSLFVDIALDTVESISFYLYFVVLRNIDSVSLQYNLLLRSISGTFMLGLFDIICWNSKNIFSNTNNLVNEVKYSLDGEMFMTSNRPTVGPWFDFLSRLENFLYLINY